MLRTKLRLREMIAMSVMIAAAIFASLPTLKSFGQAPAETAKEDAKITSPKEEVTAATKSDVVSKNDAIAKVDAAKSVPEPKNVGGEPDGIVHVANVIYAGFKSSKCFSDHFLIDAEKETAISTSRRFHAAKLSSEDLYGFPMIIMTGEGAFTLPDGERKNLRKFIERGGFLLASAGCSSEEWDRSFRREMAIVFPENSLKALEMTHPVFHTVHDIDKLEAKHGVPKPLEGVTLGGRLGVIYSQDGLNDTAHTQGCCCCGGNEIYGAAKVNVNILAYALTY